MKLPTTTLKQPHVITRARYEFDKYEMKVFIHIIKDIQRLLSFEEVEVQKTLFGEINHKIYFRLSDLLLDDQNHSRMKKALKNFRKKDFEIEDEKRWLNVGLIDWSEYNKEAKKWEIQISHKLMPYLVSLARGYTTYQLEVILKLNTHSQRLYMLLNQFSNESTWYKISADELRKILCLEENYDKYGNFKDRVIKSAEKQMKELYDKDECDLWFKLKQDKKKRGAEEFDRMLEFTVFSSEKRQRQIAKDKADHIQYATNVMKSIFTTNYELGNSIVTHVINVTQLKAFCDRLKRIEDQALNEGKSLPSYAGLMVFIAENDFEFRKKKQK
jgi:plasmid replication initiation protein